MENSNHATAFMGFDRKKLDSLNREYARLNPHNLPELRRRQRTRFSSAELVASTSRRPVRVG